LSKLCAPLIPFVSEEIYQNLVCSVSPGAPESVHLCDFPVGDASKIDSLLDTDTRLTMKVCSLGRAARSKAGIKVRQPLEKVMIKTRSKSEREGLGRLASQVLEELNVKGIEFVEDVAELESKPDCFLAVEGEYTVAVSRDISAELIDEGIAREVVHRIQNMRRNAGFDIADYIVTCYQAESPLKEAIERFADYIRQETLSRELLCRAPEEGTHSENYRINTHPVTLGVKRTGS